jgi:hypothetical protein
MAHSGTALLLLVSILKGWYLLQKGTKISLSCKQHKALKLFISSGKQFTVLQKFGFSHGSLATEA